MLILFCSYMSQVFWAWPFVHRPISHLLWSCFCLEDGVGWKSLPHDFFGCECSSRKTFPGKEGSFGSENLVNAGKKNLPFHVLRSIPGSPRAPIKNQWSSYFVQFTCTSSTYESYLCLWLVYGCRCQCICSCLNLLVATWLTKYCAYAYCVFSICWRNSGFPVGVCNFWVCKGIFVNWVCLWGFYLGTLCESKRRGFRVRNVNKTPINLLQLNK